ncbi:MAG TPA: pseudouridine synthase [Bacteroidia bacterium]|jgi:23S rRNA pseudouridine2457 synthase|nr:pseudouridine synthase [Bacteroidia bacterium]
MFSYFIIYKPYKMLSQFVRMPKKKVLADLVYDFPAGTNALGRLDENSEGLLILSTDKQLTNLLLQPQNQHARVYWVQVHGKVSEETLQTLEVGISIRMHKEDYATKPCKARIIDTPNNLAQRGHPVRDDITTTWIELILTEGKFHQVRKMTAAVGHQTMRLIRVAIEDILLLDMKPGEVKEIAQEEIYSKLKIQLPITHQ